MPGLERANVGPHAGQQQREQFLLGEHLGRDAAVAPVHLGHESVIVQDVQGRTGIGHPGRAPGRDEEVERQRRAAALERLAYRVRQGRSHAVAEEGVGPVELRLEGGDDGLDEGRDAGHGRLAEARAATGQLHRHHVEGRGQAQGPGAEVGRPAARMVKAEKPGFGLRARRKSLQPRLR